MTRNILTGAAAAGLALLLFVSHLAAAGYDELLAQAKRDPAGMDFTALRYAYAESASYDPYGSAEAVLRASMMKAFGERDCANAIKAAQSIIEKNYVHIDAHATLDICYGRLDQPEQAKPHGLMVRGLIASIVRSGDGKSPKTAFVVISIGEEYSLMTVLGLKKVRQALTQADGHHYDRIVVENRSGGTDTVFFNIDRMFGSLDKMLTPR